MPSPPDLAATQRLFWELITAPEGVEVGAASVRAAGRREADDLASMVRGDERLGAAQHLDIYADMYFYRLRDCLAEDFPKVAAVIGGARFHNLATDYVLAHPSSSWTLRELGRALPGYLETHELREDYPYLADLARLEWARYDVFDEADATPITRSALAGLAPTAIEKLTLAPVPAARLLALDWSVAPLWRQVEDREAAVEPGASHSAAIGGETCQLAREPMEVDAPVAARAFVRVWRQEFTICHRSIDAEEHACLAAMSDCGATLPALCDVVLKAALRDGAGGSVGEVHAAAQQRMAGYVQRWLEDGFVRRGV